MQAVAYQPKLAEAWNSFNHAARNGHFLFDRCYMDYHADRFDDASLALVDDGTIVGLIAANRVGDTVHSHQGLTFGGLVSEAGASRTMAILDACLAVWRSAGARRLVYKAQPWIYHERPSQEDLYWLFRRDAVLVRRDVTTAIDVRAPGQVSSRRQRGARKAQKADLRFGRSERWAEFWALLAGVLEGRHGAAPVHSLAEIRRLAAAFPKEISLYVCEQDDRLLAGVVMFASRQVAHAQYIAVGEEGRALGALDGLFLWLIEAFRSYRYFDFGISNTDQGRVLNEGLILQKEEFGGSAVAHDFYRLEI